MFALLKTLYSILISIGHWLQPIVLLAIRLFWGWQFFLTGSGKLRDIGPIIDYFQTLGIPWPEVNAYLSATTECVGGLCLLVGFASRLVSIPLAITMTVALLTAHSEAIMNITSAPLDVVTQLPFTFWWAAILIFTFGPGAVSIDALLKRYFFSSSSASSSSNSRA